MKKKVQYKFNIGDKIRIRKERLRFFVVLTVYAKKIYRNIFYRGFRQQFSAETFTVTRRLFKKRAEYWIADNTGEEIIGRFFENELIKVYKNWKIK